MIVGARDSVPSFGPNNPLADPGRGGGVTSIGFGGFGDGAAEDAVLMAVFGVVFLVVIVMLVLEQVQVPDYYSM